MFFHLQKSKCTHNLKVNIILQIYCFPKVTAAVCLQTRENRVIGWHELKALWDTNPPELMKTSNLFQLLLR